MYWKKSVLIFLLEVIEKYFTYRNLWYGLLNVFLKFFALRPSFTGYFLRNLETHQI